MICTSSQRGMAHLKSQRNGKPFVPAFASNPNYYTGTQSPMLLPTVFETNFSLLSNTPEHRSSLVDSPRVFSNRPDLFETRRESANRNPFLPSNPFEGGQISGMNSTRDQGFLSDTGLDTKLEQSFYSTVSDTTNTTLLPGLFYAPGK